MHKNKIKMKEIVYNSNVNKIQLAALTLIVNQNDAVAAVSWGSRNVVVWAAWESV